MFIHPGDDSYHHYSLWYKTIGAASYPLSINDAKHPLTILKGINTTDEKMTNPFAG